MAPRLSNEVFEMDHAPKKVAYELTYLYSDYIVKVLKILDTHDEGQICMFDNKGIGWTFLKTKSMLVRFNDSICRNSTIDVKTMLFCNELWRAYGPNIQ